MRFQSILFFLLVSAILFGQDTTPPKNWYQLNPSEDGFPGISSSKAHRDYLKGDEGEEIIVAILDSGLDVEHEDLKDNIWVNTDEIPGNGIDDDKNGYIDDIHGWNFLGNGKGKNLHHSNLEVTRQYNLLKAKFDGKKREEVSKKERDDYDKYVRYGKVIETKRKDAEENAAYYSVLIQGFDVLAQIIGKEPAEIQLEDLEKLETKNEVLTQLADVMKTFVEQVGSFEQVLDDVEELYDYYYAKQYYHYNTDFRPRDIVGDNPDDPYERNYGNPDVKGPFSKHGTQIGGIIGSVRDNGIGTNGIAANVKLMGVRVVPNGDERDKDVANGIRYAVDNGASIINMSFGKGESPNKRVVDEAIKYALENDVLIVHAAGNDQKEVDRSNNFPNDRFDKAGWFKPRYAKNWIEVGATNWQKEENLVADFSNYSKTWVDIFAPGTEMYATSPNNTYEETQGTSFAAPVVSAVAAVIRSNFPDLTAEQVKEIIMFSVDKPRTKVVVPGKEKKVSFGALSVSGGIVNLNKALKLAANTKGKKKGKSRNKALQARIQQGTVKAKDRTVVP